MKEIGDANLKSTHPNHECIRACIHDKCVVGQNVLALVDCMVNCDQHTLGYHHRTSGGPTGPLRLGSNNH